jgi:hypothetical protein
MNDDKIVILWTSGDRETAINLVFLYGFNAKDRGWWKDVTLVVWGPSAKLLSEDAELQDRVRKMKDAGVELRACVRCAEYYGVVEDLERLGIEMVKMGIPLTEYLKQGVKVLSV